ncbi:hypothetical protein M9H77_18476 [Catharanthus roseus]|uniref:Uncharacterized protein n=1 Tax=Catharanthus roseus TaxID=4058 RepID=A0ACC0B7L8_CATRO|nr:hypothetical protein M9H77_18476 [Catharanthus roseus]
MPDKDSSGGGGTDFELTTKKFLRFLEKDVPSESKNDEKETKTNENGAIAKNSATYSTAIRKQRPTADGRPCLLSALGYADKGRLLKFQNFYNSVSWIQELNTLIQDFDLQLSDSKDELGRP